MKPLLKVIVTVTLAFYLKPVAAQDSKINLLPMYGGFKKSKALQRADADFLTYCDQNFPSRKEAAAQFAKRGWDFYYANDYSTAVKRYNQAWLLDSTNASAYWGFGVIEGNRQNNTDALRYFQTSLRLDPTNRRVFVDMGQALISRYLVMHYSPDLDVAIEKLQLYLADTSDVKVTTDAYMRMAVAYFFKKEYATAWKYADLTTALSPDAAHDWELLPELQKAAPRAPK
jgi:tetratricopeptide (TPR) repeat protein